MAKKSTSRNTNYHVTQRPEGWAAKREGTKRAASVHSTQAAAERAAKGYVKRAGGGEVKIHGRGGQIRDSDTMPKARDPNPPKDRRH